MSEYRTPEEDTIGGAGDPDAEPGEGGPPPERARDGAETQEREGQATERRDP